MKQYQYDSVKVYRTEQYRGDTLLEGAAVLRSVDQFDIVRVMPTEGPNYELYNVNLIRELKIWDEKYGIQIVEARPTEMMLFFDELPEDVETFFKEEVLRLSPWVRWTRDSSDIASVGDHFFPDVKQLSLWWD
jgi:hypothetical protein